MNPALIVAMALATGGIPTGEAPLSRVHGPIRDLRSKLRVVVYVLRRGGPSVGERAAEIMCDLLAERGLKPGCHVRKVGGPELEGEQVFEWFAGQLPKVQRTGDSTLLLHWLQNAHKHLGEERPRTVVVVTPENAAKLTAADVRKLAAATEKRERRARRTRARLYGPDGRELK